MLPFICLCLTTVVLHKKKDCVEHWMASVGNYYKILMQLEKKLLNFPTNPETLKMIEN